MSMAVAVKDVNASLGDIIVVGSRRYEVVDDREGGLALEPAVGKTVAEMRSERGSKGLAPAEFEELFGDLPSDGEG